MDECNMVLSGFCLVMMGYCDYCPLLFLALLTLRDRARLERGVSSRHGCVDKRLESVASLQRPQLEERRYLLNCNAEW